MKRKRERRRKKYMRGRIEKVGRGERGGEEGWRGGERGGKEGRNGGKKGVEMFA